MKHEISALMDGELFEDDADYLINRLKNNPAARKNWAAYHLIGDVLRQPDHIHCDLSAKVRELLRDEPTVFAPHGRGEKQKIRAFALSVAASLAGIGVVAWMSLQVGSEAPSQLAMQQNELRQVKTQIRAKSNDYLMAHQEFSPSTDMSGGAYYIRTVSYSSDEIQTRNNSGK